MYKYNNKMSIYLYDISITQVEIDYNSFKKLMLEQVAEPTDEYIKKEWEKFEMNTKVKEQRIKFLLSQIKSINTCLSIWERDTNDLEEEREYDNRIDYKIMDIIQDDE
jgi:hypothetical protein